MTTPNLRLLQLNIWKSRPGMEALINDPQTQNLDMLLIQEPPLTAYNTHVNHSAWHLYQSTCQEDTPKKRSLLYVSRRISTASHRQIKCNHPDVTAVKLWTTEQQTLIFSVYVPTTNHSQTLEEISIQPMLGEIEACIQQATETTDKPTTIIMAGDFNRHHPMWSKNRIYHVAIEQAEELVSFFHKHGLQSCLPRGTPTHWSMSYPGSNSTIDLTSAEENLSKLQKEDIPRIEQWAKQTGSCFAAEKTELIHFTRKKSEQAKGRLVIQGVAIEPSATAKLLGVVCDRELRWKEHVQQAVNRATKANIALAGLRHLRPGQMRQVYQACVTPIMDYASTVWHNPLKDKRHLRVLNTVQRSALIRILSAFRTVATTTMEVETYTLPTHLRLKQRAQNVIISLCTLPRDHPIQEVLARARRRRDNIGSRPRFPLAESMKTMRLEQLDGLETIDPKPMIPWDPPGFVEIDIEPDRERAKDKATALQASSNMVVFSDASGQNNHLGAAAVMLDHNQEVIESRQLSIGSMANWSVYAAELIGIFYAISLVLKVASSRPRVPTTSQQEPATILCDNMSALQAIRNPRNKSGQRIIHANLQAASELRTRGIPLRLQWIPGHCDDPGNDAADELAKMAVGSNKMHPFNRLVSQERAGIRKQILKEWEQEWKTSTKGSHLRRIDSKLPAIRTRRLYGPLPRNRAYLLTQLRAGHCWLAPYGKLHGHREDDKCECGAKETVNHVILDCPKLRTPRRTLREEVGEVFGDIPAMLGGKGETSHVRAVLDFAEASQRFRSRGPRGPQRQNQRQTATTGP
ncbi:uncharacterized protein LOC106673621 [Cimex lectularius]|uniref:RNase H type-1 domain-containing protein n=1 Tax=Cimex lectularius TaxID=79782 RepID=A0A8I6SRM7_CIMLE|nr:uncharacterized protein LOC106673621 [Cimex lectularius]